MNEFEGMHVPSPPPVRKIAQIHALFTQCSHATLCLQLLVATIPVNKYKHVKRPT
jgi:hypothetical protein